MEALQGRPSLLHNGVAAGAIGMAGVQAGALRVPIVPVEVVYSVRYRAVGGPAAFGFLVYGGIGMVLASLSGKRM